MGVTGMSSIVGLHNIKDPANLGLILRTAYLFKVEEVVVTEGNHRVTTESILHPANTPKYDKVAWTNKILNCIPEDYTPVVIERGLSVSEPLFTFNHPIRAFYIFGPENGSVPDEIVEAVKECVHIPTPKAVSMNLSHAVSTVLYDRWYKAWY